MGLPAIVAMMAAGRSLSFGRGSGRRRREPVSNVTSSSNKYGEQFREQIIKNTISRARPRMLGMIGFDICAVNQAATILGIPYVSNDAYRLLDAYHCVTYWKIPSEIRRIIPKLIREALTRSEHP